MAILSDLVQSLAKTSGVPEATVFAYGRFAREGGYIAQKGRGRGAASMSPADAANLVLAVLGTETTRDAPRAIRAYRPLRGWFGGPTTPAQHAVFEWLKPLGVIADRYSGYELAADFGGFLEYLISNSAGANLNNLLRAIPTVAVTDENLKLETVHRNGPAELLFELGATRALPQEIRVGEDVFLLIRCERTKPSITVSFGRRYMHGADRFFTIHFGQEPEHPAGDLTIEATIGVLSIAALGACLAGSFIPKDTKPEDIGEFLFGASGAGASNSAAAGQNS